MSRAKTRKRAPEAPLSASSLLAATGESGYGMYKDAIAASDRAIAELEIARAFVPHILASGVLAETEDDATVAISYMVKRFGRDQDEEKARQAAVAAVRRLSPEDTAERLAILSALQQGFNLAMEWGRYGYLVGLAVGQQLGSDAFTSGGTKGRRDV